MKQLFVDVMTNKIGVIRRWRHLSRWWHPPQVRVAANYILISYGVVDKFQQNLDESSSHSRLLGQPWPDWGPVGLFAGRVRIEYTLLVTRHQ